ncbi:hypothetical protein [Pseudomonas sp. B21-053]|uniref:hypothetical protein n=1 Tax=Pseudomonas sp. B21-053 TaxID=2895493 RepID=UPI00222E6B63|nr:hypothetical protein [Pseudomonas sp. B21-053]UZE10858.1 hypothetical protein LOY68_25730 [Pseudomonas sp. B21-053]
MKISTGWLGLVMALMVPSAEAINQEIRALFTPDPAQPQRNVFINKTPDSGYCSSYPSECKQNNMFSIRIPVRFGPSPAIAPGTGVSVKVPANWRQLTVTNRETGESETVEVRITGIGSQYTLSNRAVDLAGGADAREGHQRLWGGQTWVYAPPPCLYSGVGVYSDSYYRFFWKTPVEAACTKVAAYRIPFMTFDTLDFAYELRTPNPLGMSSGLYTGSMNYFLGPGQDFDLGGLNPDDGNLTLDFVLDVQHTLKVTLPPGGNKVEMVPEGGWQSWINEGRKPNRLFRDQTFHISASSRFKMMLICPSIVGSNCVINDLAARKYGMVELKVTLPNGLTDQHGRPVNRFPLTIGSAGALHLMPSFYVDNGKGILHFEIGQFWTHAMLESGQAGNYIGTMTVIWDSEV